MSFTPSRPTPTTLGGLDGFYRLSVAQYRKMCEAGVLYSGEPVELLEGLLVNQPRPLSPRAASVRTRFHSAMMELPPAGWFFSPIPAITLGDSEPEADFAVVRGTFERYDQRFPGPTEVGMVGEVSESSLLFDRVEKGRIYARAGIPVYWLLNVAERGVEVYTDPDPAADPPAYRTRTDFAPGQDVPLVLDGVEVGRVPVADLIP